MTLTTSSAGIDLLIDYETFLSSATLVEAGGIYTIGYGHRSATVGANDTITEQQARELLAEDLIIYETAVRNNFTGTIPLTQNQFDALVLWTYNTGAGSGDSVWTQINGGNYAAAMMEMLTWRNADFTDDGVHNPIPVAGLIKRINDQIQLFMGGDSTRGEDATDRTGDEAALISFIKTSIINGLNNGTVGIGEVFEALVAVGMTPSLQQAYLDALDVTGRNCFAAGTKIHLADGNMKAIELICPGDIVLSYDTSGALIPGCVIRTFQNEVDNLLDVHGLKVTPGHVTLCGDGVFSGHHVPILDILLSDGALVKADGSLIRAAINQPVGSLADKFVQVAFAMTTEDAKYKRMQNGMMRVGTLLFDRDAVQVSVLDCILAEGLDFDPDTGLVGRRGEAFAPLNWFGPLPRPEDYVLARSGTNLEAIRTSNEGEPRLYGRSAMIRQN